MVERNILYERLSWPQIRAAAAADNRVVAKSPMAVDTEHGRCRFRCRDSVRHEQV